MAERYAGIDWASEKHDVLVADETGAEVVAASFAHEEKGLTALCRTLVRLEVVLVAIEVRTGCWWSGCLKRVAGAPAASEQARGGAGAVPGLAREVGSV